MSDVLRTGRLALHPLSMSDHRALLAHLTGPQVRRHLLDDRLITPLQVSEIISASQRDFAVEGYGLWALRPAARASGIDPAGGDVLLGLAGLRRHDGPDDRGVDVEILYSLEPNRWGQGFAAEAARAVLDYAFGVLGLHRVTAEIDRGSAVSAEVAERLGMRPWRGGRGGHRADEGPGGADGPDGASYYAADRVRWLGSGHSIGA